MAIEALVVKKYIMDAFEAVTVRGEDFEGFNVYAEESVPYHMMFPCLIVYTPISTQVGRFVGGGRTFQLTSRVEMYINSKYSVTIDGVTYKRDDAAKVFADRGEEVLEGLVFPDTIVVEGIPTCRSTTNISTSANFQVYQINLVFFMDYVKPR